MHTAEHEVALITSCSRFWKKVILSIQMIGIAGSSSLGKLRTSFCVEFVYSISVRWVKLGHQPEMDGRKVKAALCNVTSEINC